jgi:hypothetical protein
MVGSFNWLAFAAIVAGSSVCWGGLAFYIKRKATRKTKIIFAFKGLTIVLAFSLLVGYILSFTVFGVPLEVKDLIPPK